MRNLIVTRSAAGTPLSPSNENSPCQGLEPRCLATPRQSRRRSVSTFEDLMPLPNLCNQLVVMRTRSPLHSQAWGLRPSARRNLPCAPSDTRGAIGLTSRPRRRRLAVAGFSDPKWRCRFDAAPTSRIQGHRPCRATRSPEQQPVSALSASTSPVSWLRTPPVVPSVSAGFPASPRRTRTLSADSASTPPFSRIRSAFHR